MWRRPILPLSDEERDNHLFRIPDDPIRFPVLPDVFPSPRLGERSQSQPKMETSKTVSPGRSGSAANMSVTRTLKEPLGEITTDCTGMLVSQPGTLQDNRQHVQMAS